MRRLTPIQLVDEGIDVAPPVRVFRIDERGADGRFVPITVEGHVSQVLGDGTLQIIRYRNEIPWTVRMLAAGEWHGLTVDVPSAEDIAKLEAYNLRYGQKQRLMHGETKGKAH